MLQASPAQMAADVRSWEQLGGTHASLTTMRLGLDSAAAHIDLIGQIRDELAKG